jgi:hypothetical protein
MHKGNRHRGFSHPRRNALDTFREMQIDKMLVGSTGA